MEGSCHRSGNATPPLVAVDLESTSLPTQDPIPTTNFDLLTSDEVVFCNDSMPTRAHSESEAQYQRIVSLPSPWRSKRGRTPASDGDVPVALENRGFIRPQQPESTNSTEASQIPERATTPHASQGWQHMAWRQRDVSSVSRGPETFEGFGQGRGNNQRQGQARFGLQQSRYANPVVDNDLPSQCMTYRPTRILQSGRKHVQETSSSTVPRDQEPDDESSMPPSPESKTGPRPWSHTPNPGGKEYCAYYLRNGQCDYAQRGCQYKHFFPSTWEEMERIGFICLPDWLSQIKPKMYKEVSDRLGPCPWGNFTGSRASKSRADVTREHIKAYGKNNQHASESEMVRGRQTMAPQRLGQPLPDRRNRYAPARGPQVYQAPNARGKKPLRILDSDISQPASPSRALPPVLEGSQPAPYDADDDNDAMSIASCSDLIELDSRHGSVPRFPSAVGKNYNRRSRRGSKLRNELSEAEPAVEHPVLFQNASMPRDQAQVDLVEARDAELRKELQLQAPAANGSSTVVAAKQKKAPMSGPARLQQQVVRNSKANNKSHPASNTTKQTSGKTTETSPAGNASASETSTAATSPGRRTNRGKRTRGTQKARGKKQDQQASTDAKDALIKELEAKLAAQQNPVTVDPKDARIRELEAKLAATSSLETSKATSRETPPKTSGAGSVPTAPNTSPARTGKGKVKGKGRANNSPASSAALTSTNVGSTSPGRPSNAEGKGRAQDVPAQSAPVQFAAKTSERSSPGKEAAKGPAAEGNVTTAAVPSESSASAEQPSK